MFGLKECDVIFWCVQSSWFGNYICKLSEDKMKESHNKVKEVNIFYAAKQTQSFSLQFTPYGSWQMSFHARWILNSCQMMQKKKELDSLILGPRRRALVSCAKSPERSLPPTGIVSEILSEVIFSISKKTGRVKEKGGEGRGLEWRDRR